ncbi:MAG: hypothetical protein HMLKMBBP_00206 [Planctomycetes bacterium]|nr:hypothetical protein [Planctomycetota bacterium]
MFDRFFLSLRDAKVPVSLREYLTLLEAVERGCADFDVERFYELARTTLVKDERHYDRFDRVFAAHFGNLGEGAGLDPSGVPAGWLEALARRVLSEEEKALVKSLGGFEKLMEELRKRLLEQKDVHRGGSKWIGTGGTSPFGAMGYHPEGVRIGPVSAGNRTAVKVWDRREFRDYDDDAEVGVRTFQMALRRLRRFTREGRPDVFDVDGTIDATARNAGLLDAQFVPERRNRPKVLLLLDVGGSMDDHVETVTQLFSAARAEFTRLVPFQFHNCVYETLWRTSGPRESRTAATAEVLRTYGKDHGLVVVGDAAMSPYELDAPGGAIHHWNDETGAAWLERLVAHYPRAAWINPMPEARWRAFETVGRVKGIFGNRMFPLTVGGIEQAMRRLARATPAPPPRAA